MPTYKGTWTARVEQEFEFQAADDDEANAVISSIMAPENVSELLDFEVDYEVIA